MNSNRFYTSDFKGSRRQTQQDIPTINATGFGAASDDYLEKGIDLNEELIRNKPATFFFKMNGDAMSQSGIQSGDILVVDRSIKAGNGKIVVAAIDGELIVRRLYRTLHHRTLSADDNKCASLELQEHTAYLIWGVVTYCIRAY